MGHDTEYARQREHGHEHHGSEHHSHYEHHVHGPEGERHHARAGQGDHRRGGPGEGRFGGPRDRARRGEARYVLLDALRDGPKHGYEIIKTLEEKSGGQYVPSPGTVYPTMQYLEDQGLVRAAQESERRVYHLTDTGRAELESHAEDLAAFWERFAAPATSESRQPEIGFLREELDHLMQTIWGGLRDTSETTPETIRLLHQAVEQCRRAVREIVTAGRQE